jgi:hypothetical protein
MEFLSKSECPELESLLQYVAKRDAKLIHKATSGMGTNDDLLISVLCTKTKHQIAAIDNFYREESQGFALKNVLESEAGGNYGKALTYICRSRPQFLTEKLQAAMSGLGCDKDLVNEIFCLNSNEDIAEMRKIYEQTTDKNLADTLRSWLSGEHRELILSLLLLGRTQTEPNEAEAAVVAEKLFSKMQRGTNALGGLKDNTIAKVLQRPTPPPHSDITAFRSVICCEDSHSHNANSLKVRYILCIYMLMVIMDICRSCLGQGWLLRHVP